MKGVIYARFSSEKQNETSIEGQIRECTEYANFNDIEIVNTYIDRAFSARTANRPDFQKMIKDSYKNNFDCVIVWKLDRFARDRYDSAYYKNILKKNGVRVISAKETISQGADGILLESILEGYAEYYSAELSEKVKRGMTENALKGKANGVNPPFGYYVDENDYFQLNETLVPIIKDVFNMFLSGKKTMDIVRILNERGIKNNNKPITYSVVYRMLTNRKYLGEYKFGDVVLPNMLPQIISEDIFNQVQKRFEQNKKAPAMHRAEDNYLLTTKLFCGKCGAMMTGEIGTSKTKAKYRYYKCNRAKKHNCDKKAVKKDWIENLVLDKILELIKEDSVIESLAEKVYELQDNSSDVILALKAELNSVETKLTNIANAIAQGHYSKTTNKLMQDLEVQKQQLEENICKENIAHPILSKEQILFLLQKLQRINIDTMEGKQKLIDCFVNSIYLYDDYFIITFNYKGDSKTVTFSEVESSSIKTTGLP